MREGGDGVPRPGRGLLARSLLAALAIATLTAGASATAALLKIDDLLPAPPTRDDVIRAPLAATRAGKPQTILLLGSDKRWRDRAEDRVRSDTLMLVRLDPKQRATTVLSLPRDLRTRVPGRGVMKINDAYALGGPELAIATVTELTGLKIHHVVNVNFRGFRAAINLFDCFYVDVDRRYFHSNAGLPESERYDAIDLQPGYQRLCGNDALDYVRFRHADSDLTRAARQQDVLRAAKDQISTSRIVDDLERLGVITAEATQTDAALRTKAGFLRVAKLALGSADQPVRQLDFPATFTREGEGDRRAEYVDAAPAAVAEVVDRFLHGGGEAARRPVSSGRRAGSVRAAELVEARASAERLVRDERRSATTAVMGFPVRFPSHITPTGRYDDPLRIYGIRDRSGTLYRAYRFTLAHNRVDGQFYGVQGMSWRNPPLLAHPSATRTVRGRRLELFRAGSRLRFVAWRTDRAVYWISNTLNLKLTNAEMLALAASLTTRRS